MILHSKVLQKNGKKEFAVITYDDFLKVQDALDDYESLKALREAKEKEYGAQNISFSKAKKVLNIE